MRIAIHWLRFAWVWFKWRPRGYQVYYYPPAMQRVLDECLGKRSGR